MSEPKRLIRLMARVYGKDEEYVKHTIEQHRYRKKTWKMDWEDELRRFGVFVRHALKERHLEKD